MYQEDSNSDVPPIIGRRVDDPNQAPRRLEQLELELLLSFVHAAAGYVAAIIPLAFRRVLAACLDWNPHPTFVWVLGSSVLGLLTVTMVGFRREAFHITRIALVRLLGRILFAVPVFPFGLYCVVVMAPDGIRMLPHIWPFLCSLVVLSALGFLVLWCSLYYDGKVRSEERTARSS